jgi:hypothetical protein
VVTKRSGQAQTALISRRPATVERTRGRHPPRKDQGDNKPSTNRRPGQTDSDSQTKRVKFFGRIRPLGLLGRLRAFPFRPAPGPKHRQINNLANRERRRQLCWRGRPTSSLVAKALPARSRAASIRDVGEGTGHKRSRNQRRGASDDSPGKRQSEFARLECCRSVMVAKAFPPPQPRCPDPGHGRRERAQREPESATRRGV